MNNNDLIGYRVGRLVVKEEVESTYDKQGRRIRNYLCQCDCGGTKIAARFNIINSATRSCGCLRKEISQTSYFERRTELSGETFGKLEVLHQYPKRSGSVVYWVCRCECGIEVAYSSRELLSGKAKDCGVCGGAKEAAGEV